MRALTTWPIAFGSCHDTASSLVRSCIIPKKGKVLIGADFAGIESRVLAWIAGEINKLELFKKADSGNGPDNYCYQAGLTFGREITKADKDERQVGKCQELGLGFQGGIAAFYKMCQIYAVSLCPVVHQIWSSASVDEKERAEFAYNSYKQEAERSGSEFFGHEEGLVADIIKQRWRNANPKIVEFWDNVNREAIEAVKDIPCRDRYKNLRWFKEGQFLYCELPSGRPLAYNRPIVQEMKNRFGTVKETLTYMTIDAKTKQYVRRAAYGGLLTENIVQAISRDIMVEKMFLVKKHGHDIVLTAHDEILSESDPSTEVSEIENLMSSPIEWCQDLPLKAEAWKGTRYRK